jgi:hypothetical protein
MIDTTALIPAASSSVSSHNSGSPSFSNSPDVDNSQTTSSAEDLAADGAQEAHSITATDGHILSLQVQGPSRRGTTKSQAYADNLESTRIHECASSTDNRLLFRDVDVTEIPLPDDDESVDERDLEVILAREIIRHTEGGGNGAPIRVLFD